MGEGGRAGRPLPTLLLRVCRLVVLAGLTLATGCAGFGSDSPPPARETPGSVDAPSGRIQVRATDELAVAHVVGNRIRGVPGIGRRQRLAAPVNAALTGTLAPAAVPPPGGGRSVAYHAFDDGRPVLRRYDAAGDRDVVIARGAFSVAWRRDRALAYFKALSPKVNDPRRYRGHIVVRSGGRETRWTERPARYVVAGWAGDRLLAYRLTRLSGDVIVLDGPGRQRMLMRNAFLVAISPDGRRAFTSRPDASGAGVRVVDLATGAPSAELSLRRDEASDGRQPTTFVSAGSWFGDRVVGATNLGLLVFRVSSSTIALEQELDIDPTVFPTSLQEPHAVDADGRRIVAWAELVAKPRQAVPDAALVECDRLTLRCRQGPSSPGLQPPRPVYNPSRP